MPDLKKDIVRFVLILLSGIGGFYIGKTKTVPVEAPLDLLEKKATVAVVKIEKITTDLLEFSLSENVRLIWANGKNSVEGVGLQTVPLGQIENENSKKLADFEYLGNAKTKKFYPSSSYPARGTEIRHRRFFDTKEAALAAGFVASKLVK